MNIDELAKRIYNTLSYCEFYRLVMENKGPEPDVFIKAREVSWPKYRGDLKQLARSLEFTEK